MSDFPENEMNHAVQGFAAQITEFARHAAIGTVESAFNGRSTAELP